jgi:hypothetical protein
LLDLKESFKSLFVEPKKLNRTFVEGPDRKNLCEFFFWLGIEEILTRFFASKMVKFILVLEKPRHCGRTSTPMIWREEKGSEEEEELQEGKWSEEEEKLLEENEIDCCHVFKPLDLRNGWDLK